MYREVSVIEVREVLRVWLSGAGFRRVAALAGVDRKTVRRYVAAAVAAGLALLAASMVLAAVVSFQFRFLFGAAAFWTPDYRSMFMLVFPVLWLVSGFVIPVDFFPGPLRALVDWSPLILTLPDTGAIAFFSASFSVLPTAMFLARSAATCRCGCGCGSIS